jgi:hypothetical protein
MPVLEHAMGGKLDLDHMTGGKMEHRQPEQFVFLRSLDDPATVQARKPFVADRYDIQPVGLSSGATTVLYSFYGQGAVVLPRKSALWETWLPEIDARVALPASQPTTTVGRQIEDIQRITGFSDSQLAAAFPGGVSRETVNRWRNRPISSLRSENVYRLGILHELAQHLDEAGIHAPVWLHQPVAGGTETPYALICMGRLGDVRLGVESVAMGAVAATEPMRMPDVSREWDTVVDEDEDDDAGWSWSGSVENAN